MSLLSNETFLGHQKDAVFSDSAAIAVTAGAGSGKTRSLVGRYLRLLERGYPLRSILAITFTEKAAREMWGRIRAALLPHPDPLPQGEGRASVQIPHSASRILHSEIDSARIGTIHSLCAEILRQYPAEAGLDPAFTVMEEGLAAALKAEALDSALAWAADDAESVALFGPFKESELRQALGILLERRLEIQDLTAKNATPQENAGQANAKENNKSLGALSGFGGSTEFAEILAAYLSAHLASPAWLDPISDLTSYAAKSPDDKLELSRREVLARWDDVQSAFAAKDWDAQLAKLADLRKAIDTRGGRKDAWDESSLAAARESMSALKEYYEEKLKFLAEKSRFALDEQVAAHLPNLLRLLDQVLLEYQRRKDERQALDFDDLEGRAAQLLVAHPEVCARLQSDLRAVLVDEFQDTNDRQRQIVYALTGFSADSKISRFSNLQSQETLESNTKVDLFIVGDSKQSIYKFRGADVSVFRQVQQDVQDSGGERLDLDLTFRAHKELLETLNRLLAPVLGETDDPARPYLVPFAPLRHHRAQPAREQIQPPYVEVHLGLGENAEEGRQTAAAALAVRLRQLHETEGFAWGDVALLFRASSAFPVYETALEGAGIPFVTVAGRGFYDRPEIRDLLNILAAVADPADDLALVGLLRSPAFAIPDAEIYQLCFSPLPSGDGQGVRASLRGSNISSHQRASAILDELRALSGRAPAAAVLKRLLDLTGYRAILSSVPNPNSLGTSGARMVRNVEKLLADAHRSRLTSLPAFLAYVRTLRDVGLREGEAPADSQTSGATQLMTVHKAKGLEFPLTVIADASYEPRPRSAKAQVAPDGLLLDLKDGDFHPTAWQIAACLEDERDDAEDRRLLYVAATRAKEKLLISGHVKAKKDGFLSIPGWLGKLGLEQIKIPVDMSQPEHTPLNELGLTVTLYPVPLRFGDFPAPLRFGDFPAKPAENNPPLPQGEGLGVRANVKADLLEPLAAPIPVADEKARALETNPPQRVWRIVPDTKRPHAPAWVVGKLVHESLRRWRFPSSNFDDFLKPFALEAGLTDPGEIHAAIHETRRLLENFCAHPLYAELEKAERHHEIPYYTPAGRGIIDLLYRSSDGWMIIDFKTDRADSEEQAQVIIHQNGYTDQLTRYVCAIREQLGIVPRARLVFLNMKGQPVVFDL